MNTVFNRMIVQRAYKHELGVNNVQRTLLKKHAGASRFAYNWGLAQRQELYENNTGKRRYTNAIRQHRLLNSLKKIEFPWMYEVSKCAPQEALRDLDKAYQNFFRSRKKGGRVGFPKFKKKGRSLDSFRLTGIIKITDNRIQLPRLGKLKMKGKNHAYHGRILSATVSNRHNRWYVSVLVEEITHNTKNKSEIVGVDLGINVLAYLSNRRKFENPRHMKSRIRKLKRLSRSASRKMKGSNNQGKAYTRLNNFHYRVGNQRKNTINHLTNHLSSNYGTVIIEDLKVSNMVKNRKLAFSLQDAGFGEFKRQMEYKCRWNGVDLMLADTFFPSSRLCNNCGQKKSDLDLSVRIYTCECGYRCDRDLNAGRNLRDYPLFEMIKKLTGKWIIPKTAETSNKNTVVASELFFQSRRSDASRLKTPDGENVRSVGLRFGNKSDAGTVLDETGNEHQKYPELC